jgi:hypothetical protein
VGYDHQKRNQEIQLNPSNHLEDYVLELWDEKLLPPAIFITDDDFLKQTLGDVQPCRWSGIGLLNWDRPSHYFRSSCWTPPSN